MSLTFSPNHPGKCMLNREIPNPAKRESAHKDSGHVLVCLKADTLHRVGHIRSGDPDKLLERWNYPPRARRLLGVSVVMHQKECRTRFFKEELSPMSTVNRRLLLEARRTHLLRSIEQLERIFDLPATFTAVYWSSGAAVYPQY